MASRRVRSLTSSSCRSSVEVPCQTLASASQGANLIDKLEEDAGWVEFVECCNELGMMKFPDSESRGFPLYWDFEFVLEPEKIAGQLAHQYFPESGFIVCGFGWVGHGVWDSP